MTTEQLAQWRGRDHAPGLVHARRDVYRTRCGRRIMRGHEVPAHLIAGDRCRQCWPIPPIPPVLPGQLPLPGVE